MGEEDKNTTKSNKGEGSANRLSDAISRMAESKKNTNNANVEIIKPHYVAHLDPYALF